MRGISSKTLLQGKKETEDVFILYSLQHPSKTEEDEAVAFAPFLFHPHVADLARCCSKYTVIFCPFEPFFTYSACDSSSYYCLRGGPLHVAIPVSGPPMTIFDAEGNVVDGYLIRFYKGVNVFLL